MVWKSNDSIVKHVSMRLTRYSHKHFTLLISHYRIVCFIRLRREHLGFLINKHQYEKSFMFIKVLISNLLFEGLFLTVTKI